MKVLALVLALCGTTLNALWPLIASAKPAGIPHDICSANGSKRQSNGENSGEVPNLDHRLSHCAFCLVSTDSDPAISSRFVWVDEMLTEISGYFAAAASILRQAAFHSLAISRSRAPTVFA